MDLGLQGKTVLITGGSKGIGLACADVFAAEGCAVHIAARNAQQLEAAQVQIQARHGVRITTHAVDLRDGAALKALATGCAGADILVNNNGGPPPGFFQNWDEAAWLGAINANMLPALMLIRGLLPGMRARKFGRIVNITSAMVKSPMGPMGLSTAARTALTAACKALVPEVAPDNVTINSLLPERFDTERQQGMAKLAMAMKNITYEQAREEIANSIAAKRFGRPEEFGDACAFLCSAQSGFISGQQLQLDGGSYKGLV
jgi:3-oxoacyl-[acyl-carrier protein] reductase